MLTSHDEGEYGLAVPGIVLKLLLVPGVVLHIERQRERLR